MKPVRMAVRAAQERSLEHLAVSNLASELMAARDELRDRHARYCRDVSSAEMAVSLETAAFLDVWIRHNSPRHALDLGSGLSTFVMARAMGDPSLVSSADDSTLWLEQTRHYLAQEGVHGVRLHVWDDGIPLPKSTYDMVFHDLGNMATRWESLPLAADFVAPGGYLVVDDVHKLGYRFKALRFLLNAGFEITSLWPETRDSHDRHAWIARRVMPR